MIAAGTAPGYVNIWWRFSRIRHRKLLIGKKNACSLEENQQIGRKIFGKIEFFLGFFT